MLEESESCAKTQRKRGGNGKKAISNHDFSRFTPLAVAALTPKLCIRADNTAS